MKVIVYFRAFFLSDTCLVMYPHQNRAPSPYHPSLLQQDVKFTNLLQSLIYFLNKVLPCILESDVPFDVLRVVNAYSKPLSVEIFLRSLCCLATERKATSLALLYNKTFEERFVVSGKWKSFELIRMADIGYYQIPGRGQSGAINNSGSSLWEALLKSKRKRKENGKENVA
jgi:hypothetical protein